MSSLRRVSFLAAALCSFLSAHAGAAVSMYIKFDEPAIDGSSSASGHEKEIEVLSWNHGFVQPTSPTRSTAGSGTVEQATHQNFTFTKYLDVATNSILKYCWSGKQIGKVTLRCYRSDGSTNGQLVNYLTVEMQHVIISNYSISGGPGDIPVETVSLDYGTVQYTYLDHRHANAKEVPQSVTATPLLRAGAPPSCSMTLPGASSALPVQSWSIAQGGGFIFTTRTNTTATGAIAASKKGTGGNATMTCGTVASLTLTSAKIGTVANANDSTTVTLTFGSIE